MADEIDENCDLTQLTDEELVLVLEEDGIEIPLQAAAALRALLQATGSIDAAIELLQELDQRDAA